MKKNGYLFSMVLAVGIIFSNSVSAVMLQFSPSTDSVLIGDSFDVDIVISDLYASDGTREIVSAFDLDVLYDASVLSATDITFGANLGSNVSDDPFDFFSDAWITSVFDTGRVDFAEVSWLSNDELFALQPEDNFTLATLSFVAIAEGVSQLLIDDATFPGADVKGYNPFAPFDLSNSLGTGTIAVTAPAQIPEPSTILLLLAGAWCLTTRRSRRKLTH